MEFVKKAETTLAGWYKGAPKLNAATKETLVKVWPWLALVVAALQMWAAWGLWDLARTANRILTYLGAYLGGGYGLSGKDKFFIYLSVLTLVVDAVILLLAFSRLQKRQKGGWDLVFLAGLLNVLYAIFNLLISGRGFVDFLFALIASAVGFYLLFQVRDKYKGAGIKA